MSSYGERLTARDLATLAASWIPAELAEAAGLRRVDSPTGAAIVGRTGAIQLESVGGGGSSSDRTNVAVCTPAGAKG
ncbi:MAG TPA: hypothetical protein VKN18_21005 [Blastocatellia bacterium]|nr:hypothetical protein [Blastocatellia bacterium]